MVWLCPPKKNRPGLPGGRVDKNPAANAGDTGMIPDQEDPTCLGETKPAHCNY